MGGAPDEMLDIMENIRTASDVNSQGDVCITSTYRAYLYTDDTGLWAIDDMVTGNADDVSVWNDTIITYVTHMSDPDETGFGVILPEMQLSVAQRFVARWKPGRRHSS